jgi:hypothetical protein
MRVTYAEEIGDKLIDELASGRSLSDIEAMFGMPSKRSMIYWSMGEKGAPDNFPKRYTRALEMRSEVHVDELLDVIRQAADGTIDVHVARLHTDTIKWIASKQRPKVYADRRDVRHQVDFTDTLPMADRLRRAEARLRPQQLETVTVEHDEVVGAVVAKVGQ